MNILRPFIAIANLCRPSWWRGNPPSFPLEISFKEFWKERFEIESMTNKEANRKGIILTSPLHYRIKKSSDNLDNLHYADYILTRGIYKGKALAITTAAIKSKGKDPSEIVFAQSPEETTFYHLSVIDQNFNYQEVLFIPHDRKLIEEIHNAVVEKYKETESPAKTIEWLKKHGIYREFIAENITV